MKKVLIVEDTLEALKMLKDLLEIEGYQVISAENGEEALDTFKSCSPDVVVTDLRMPKMDGFSLLATIKASEELKSIPVIIFSANATQENEKKCIDMGAFAFLPKPISIDRLLACVEASLRK
jgi:DNA-binding response OmpR family regulator